MHHKCFCFGKGSRCLQKKLHKRVKSVKIIFTKKGTKLINFSTAVTKRGIVMLNI